MDNEKMHEGENLTYMPVSDHYLSEQIDMEEKVSMPPT
jgi:hypothetical protein